jgi:hypothetical protein
MRPKGIELTREASKAKTFKHQKYSKGKEEVQAQEEQHNLPLDRQKWRIWTIQIYVQTLRHSVKEKRLERTVESLQEEVSNRCRPSDHTESHEG